MHTMIIYNWFTNGSTCPTKAAYSFDNLANSISDMYIVWLMSHRHRCNHAVTMIHVAHPLHDNHCSIVFVCSMNKSGFSSKVVSLWPCLTFPNKVPGSVSFKVADCRLSAVFL